MQFHSLPTGTPASPLSPTPASPPSVAEIHALMRFQAQLAAHHDQVERVRRSVLLVRDLGQA